MKTYEATRICIVTEKLIQDGITRVLDEFGATGYSFFEGGGKGGHGLHPTNRPTVVGAFKLVKIEAIIADRTTAEAIAEKIATNFFESYSGIIYLDKVEILRPGKF